MSKDFKENDTKAKQVHNNSTYGKFNHYKPRLFKDYAFNSRPLNYNFICVYAEGKCVASGYISDALIQAEEYADWEICKVIMDPDETIRFILKKPKPTPDFEPGDTVEDVFNKGILKNNQVIIKTVNGRLASGRLKDILDCNPSIKTYSVIDIITDFYGLGESMIIVGKKDGESSE